MESYNKKPAQPKIFERVQSTDFYLFIYFFYFSSLTFSISLSMSLPQGRWPTMQLRSVSVDLPILDISYEWDHGIKMWPFVTDFFHLA